MVLLDQAVVLVVLAGLVVLRVTELLVVREVQVDLLSLRPLRYPSTI
jgi:hypothetical protein